MTQPKNIEQDLLQYAFAELTNAFNDAKDGKSPTRSYDKLQSLYDAIAEAEKRRMANEITDEQMQETMSEQVEKLKEI